MDIIAMATGFWVKVPVSRVTEPRTTKLKKTTRRRGTNEKTGSTEGEEQAATGDAPLQKSR
ncbi:predicted protein [Chaetomium globosum CBS 148.51]|uniref:Uncharacterized protein n=1 Tax=Chaetomium globosum (strain ATCC 6205 / CBS 148.51 / DSM 1962 / NBRC 6347 / NRRL 1970) TaxID=306901 RepID=Q2H3J6_CHAGB|nr:uncharacterized protein CHGG_06769 [Chaetomium globosum CBS 148.51]EAQ90150.1 predicted protein [Chaetomium globosum CBS 148.51]